MPSPGRSHAIRLSVLLLLQLLLLAQTRAYSPRGAGGWPLLGSLRCARPPAAASSSSSGPAPGTRPGSAQSNHTSCCTLREDAQVLLEFAAAVRGSNRGALPDWRNASSGGGESAADPCTWTGIVCSTDGMVTALRLPKAGLRGTLSPSLAQITTLQQMWVPCHSAACCASNATRAALPQRPPCIRCGCVRCSR